MGVFRLKKLIPVRYADGHVDKIPSPLLNTLIETHQIIEFKRKEGWIVVGSDAIRGMNHCQIREKEDAGVELLEPVCQGTSLASGETPLNKL